MTVPLLDEDPFILPLPFPTTPVVLPHLVTSALTAHLNGPYAAMIWHTSPLSGNPSARNGSINWRHCPEPFFDALKLTAWTMINGELRPTFVRERRRMRSRVSASTVDADREQVENADRRAGCLSRLRIEGKTPECRPPEAVSRGRSALAFLPRRAMPSTAFAAATGGSALSYSVRSAVAVRVRAAQPAGSSAPSRAITIPPASRGMSSPAV